MQIAVRNWTGIDVDNKGEVFSKTELFNSFLCLLGKHFFFKFGDFWWAEESIRSSKHSKWPEFFENMYLTFRQKKSCFIQNGGTDYYLFYLYVDSDHSCSWHSGAFQHSQLKTFFLKKEKQIIQLGLYMFVMGCFSFQSYFYVFLKCLCTL